MNNSRSHNNTMLISTLEFEHLTLESQSNKHIVTLVDVKGYKIIRGYGKCIIEAINDLHHNSI